MTGQQYLECLDTVEWQNEGKQTRHSMNHVWTLADMSWKTGQPEKSTWPK